jgi:hypothetical protein
MKIKDYTGYFKTDVKNAVAAIDEVFIVSNESQLAEKIKKVTKSQIILVVIVPSHDINAPDVDNVRNTSTCLLYVLKSYSNRDKVDSDFENALEETQDVLMDIQQKMIDDVEEHGAVHLMHSFEPNNQHVDPEYNYLGCNGWSLAFTILKTGL